MDNTHDVIANEKETMEKSVQVPPSMITEDGVTNTSVVDLVNQIEGENVSYDTNMLASSQSIKRKQKE